MKGLSFYIMKMLSSSKFSELLKQYTEVDEGCITDPLISVVVPTFNHEAFINAALDGAVMQDTVFPYEIIVGEDCSTDRTREIVLGYQRKYPDKIRALLSNENHGKYTGTGRINFMRCQHACRGKYIAMCEGDDYWTDPNKLQQQVEYLESNPEYAITFHNVKVVYEDENRTHEYYVNRRVSGNIDATIPPYESGMENLVHGNYVQTPSVVFRKTAWEDGLSLFRTVPIADWSLWLLTARFGKIRYIPDVMASYRVHKGGVFSKVPLVKRKLKSLLQYPPLIQTDAFDERIRAIFREDFYRLLGEWIELCVREDAVAEVPAAFEKVAELGMTGYEKDVLLDMATRKVRAEKAREIQEGGLAFRVARKLTGTLRKK
jgi:glycosyltransferase involved in cell wall biosynthesis